MFRVTFIFVLMIQAIAWSLALLFIYAIVFNPELIGATVARIIVGFQNALGAAP